jgi:hypothetical protein
MTPLNGLVLFSATAGMEICRLYAAASLLFLISGPHPFPFRESAFSLVAALVLARLIRRTRLRVVSAVLLHGIGLAASIYWVLKGYGGLPFASAARLSDWAAAGAAIEDPLERFTLIHSLFWCFVYWLRGALLGKPDPSYALTVGRFDAGIGILFFTAFIRMGLALEEPISLGLLGGYFLFGMAALAGARSAGNDGKDLSPRGIMVLFVSFSALFIITLGGALFLYPQLARGAEEAYRGMGAALNPLTPWLVRFLRFIFGFGFARGAAEPSGAAPAAESVLGPLEEPGPWGRLIEKILAWGVLGMIGLVGLVILAWLLFKLAKYLLSRPERLPGEGGGFGDLLALLRAFVAGLLRGRRRLMDRLFAAKPGDFKESRRAFRRLCSWGRLAGIRRRRSETPGEYGSRLSLRIAGIEEDAAKIAGLVEGEFYGNRSLSAQERKDLRRALRGLGNPKYLIRRLLARLRSGF